jgi:periplasmic protein TonB
MNTNKILSASILDLVFEDRNKEYGAYELRKTYPRRITKALLITGAIAVLIFSGAILANSLRLDKKGEFDITTVTIQSLPEDEKLPEPLPEKKQPEPPVQTEKLTEFKVTPDDKADEPPPDQDDLVKSKISDFQQTGVVDSGLAEPKIDDPKGIIEANNHVEPDVPFTKVEKEAKFAGNWEKFLTKNLNAYVPGENGAPLGSYRVIIQFVVDKEGNVSDLKPLTNLGYGMEQEAMRVLKKATKWEPGIQNGIAVKSYRVQPITFVIGQEEQ